MLGGCRYCAWLSHADGRVLDFQPGAGQSGVLVVRVQFNPRQEGPGQEAAHIRAADHIRGSPALHQRAGTVVGMEDVGAPALGLVDHVLGLLGLRRDPLLFRLEEGQGDGVRRTPSARA